MNDDECRRIEELIVRYELEPQIRDVYVEGNSDKSLIEWFMREKGVKNTAVYEISTVEVPANKVKGYGLENNNKGRVITFALEIESRLGKECLKVTCIVDKDFDIILDAENDCKLLLFTDYTCMEMYVFEEKCIDKYLSIFLGGFSKPAKDVLNCMSEVLKEVFLIRLANKLLDLKLNWIKFKRCCELCDNRIDFNRDDFVTRYLNSNKMISRKREFIEIIELWRKKLKEERRCQIHGHDFMELMSWYISKHGVDKKLCNEEVIKRGLFTCLEIEHLESQPLFEQLVSRVKN